jgi:hypothetical protein
MSDQPKIIVPASKKVFINKKRDFVVRVMTIIAFDNVPARVIIVERKKSNFKSIIGSESSPATQFGGLDNVLDSLASSQLNANSLSAYRKLFRLENPTLESIAEAGFPEYDLEEVA